MSTFDGTSFEAAALSGRGPGLGAEAGAAAPAVLFVVMQSGLSANGGVESITQVLESLRRVRAVVVTQMETPANERWRGAGCDVRVWPRRGGFARSALAFNLRAYGLVRSLGCRVVHCNDIISLFHAAPGAKAAGASVVFNIRGVKAEGEKYGLRWQVARRISDRQLVLSSEMRDALAARLGMGRRGGAEGLHYIYSMVDRRRFSPPTPERREALRARLGIAPGEFAVGCVGVFSELKSQLPFIREAATRLARAVPRAKVYFVGDFDAESNEYARRCAEAARELDLEGRVRFVGYTAEVADWYGALDAVAVVSRREGLSRSMIESLACGTPVVSFEMCSAREVLERNGCGYVVPHGDYAGLVGRLGLLAGDEAGRRRLGERGAGAAAELFDPARVVGEYEELYSSLRGGRV